MRWVAVRVGYNPSVIDPAILQRIGERLARELAPPVAPLLPLVVGGGAVGWLDAARAERLLGFDHVFTLAYGRLTFVPSLRDPAQRSAALDDVARTLASEGALTAWRDERYAVAPELDAPSLFEVERAAARYFGIRTWATHANGLTTAGDITRMWIARRSRAKAIDPGRLDNLVGGGIAAGMSVAETLVKVAWEEAGLPAGLARSATPEGMVHIRRPQPDGLQRETIFVHDLPLPVDFEPANQDGEVVEFRKVALGEAARLIAQDEGLDQVTADASLVILDCLLRRGEVPVEDASYARLDALRTLGLEQ